jgi:hypothetical protein
MRRREAFPSHGQWESSSGIGGHNSHVDGYQIVPGAVIQPELHRIAGCRCWAGLKISPFADIFLPAILIARVSGSADLRGVGGLDAHIHPPALVPDPGRLAVPWAGQVFGVKSGRRARTSPRIITSFSFLRFRLAIRVGKVPACRPGLRQLTSSQYTIPPYGLGIN